MSPHSWVSSRIAYAAFCKKYPDLGLLGTEKSHERVFKRYQKALINLGVALKLHATSPTIVNGEKFDEIFFTLLINKDRIGTTCGYSPTEDARG